MATSEAGSSNSARAGALLRSATPVSGNGVVAAWRFADGRAATSLSRFGTVRNFGRLIAGWLAHSGTLDGGRPSRLDLSSSGGRYAPYHTVRSPTSDCDTRARMNQ